MEQYKVTLYFDESGWYVEQTGDNKVFVYPTMRSALRKGEALLKAQKEKEEK